jgi:hypothetical protein
MKKVVIILFFMASLCLMAEPAILIPKINTAPVLDGSAKDKVWQNAAVWKNFYQISPGDNAIPTEKTEIYLTYDENNLYFLAKNYLNDLTRMRDFHCSRDKIYTTDRVYFYLDTFNSKDQAYYFGANMHGEQADGIILSDIDPTVDIFYKSAGRYTDYGFNVEIALPFESINYKSGKDVEWGFFFKRLIPHGSEEISAQQVDRTAGNYFTNYDIIKFKQVPQKIDLELRPGFVVNSKYRKENDTENTENSYEPELNLFYQPNSWLTAKATYNPDFNIIEADGLEVDVNSRYALYYQEKRPFFIEDSNPYKAEINIFYTRRIVDPKWGFKLSGIHSDASFYGLAALDENVPGNRFNSEYSGTKDTPFGFLAVSKKLDDRDSFIRLASSVRRYGRDNNLVFSTDGFWRISPLWKLTAQATASRTTLPETDITGTGFNTELDFYNSDWYIHSKVEAISRNFQADLGFVPETNFIQLKNRAERQKHAQTEQDLIRYMEIATTQYVKYYYDSQEIKELYWEPMTGMMFKNDFQYWAGIEFIQVDYWNRLNSTYFPWLSLEYYPLKQLGGKVLMVSGKNIWYNSVNPARERFDKFETTLFIRPLSELDIEVNQKYHELENIFTARVYDIKMKLQFHKNFWLRTILQLENTDIYGSTASFTKFDIYPLFAYQPNSKIALYLGASNHFTEDKDVSQKSYFDADKEEATYFFKVNYSFDII